jgi:hypothetical protein
MKITIEKRLLEFELLELAHRKPSPDYFFNLPEWSEADIAFLLDDQDKILELLRSIRAHIHAKPPTLLFTREEPVNQGDFFTRVVGYKKYFFDRFIIYDWIIAQGLKWPESVIEWHDQQVKLKQAAATQLESEQTHHSGIDVSVQSEEKPQNETERQKMLKLILGMAMDKYGYDLGAKKNAATGDNKDGISAKIKTRGISVSNDTILKYLTEAKDLL